jgi:hypothetical protein
VLTPDPHPRMGAKQSLNQRTAAALPGGEDKHSALQLTGSPN